VELRYERGKMEIKGKVVSQLDEFVLEFTDILEKLTDYVIVGGYVAILLGRSRGTEDIDTIVRDMKAEEFSSLYRKLCDNGYYFLNPGGEDKLYRMLKDGLRIRAAREGTVIPNIKLKFVRNHLDLYAIENRVKVVFGGRHVFISPIELQIPYKLYLGSEKDVEDALYLWEIFKDKIDPGIMAGFMRALGVRGDQYGIR